MRVLLIAYYYPPVRGGGSARPAQMVRHLPAYGHEITVLSHTYRRTTLEGPELRIHDPSHNRNRRGFRRLQWACLRGITEVANRAGKACSIYGWWRRAAIRALPTVAQHFRPDVILATYSPVETLEIGLAAARGLGVPLVADFRDGLLFEPIESKRLAAHACVREHYRRIESEVVGESAAVLTALPLLKSYFEETYDAGRVVALPNAYDPEDFVDLPEMKLAADACHVVHTGSFGASDAGCDIAPFVRAVEGLVDADRASRLRIHQLGRLTTRERRLLSGLVARGVLVDHGEVDRATCLSLQKAADMALLITSLDRRSVTPGKIFEYLGAGTPILALTHRTFAEEIVTTTGAGVVVHPEDEAGITNALVSLLDCAKARPSPDPEAIAGYSVASQIQRLDQVLREVVPGKRPKANSQ